MKNVVVVCFLLFTLVVADNLQSLYLEHKLPFSPRNTPSNVGRITGGSPAVLGQFPFQAGLKISVINSNNTAFCGGTLISNRTVVTAAHCCEIATQIQVILGSVWILQETEPSRESQIVAQENIIIHNLWNTSTLENDICLLILPVAVEFNDAIKPAKLPADDSKNYFGKAVTASGWGLDSDTATSISPILRYVNSKIILNPICNVFYLGSIKDTNICMNGLGGKSTCNGDSGGPLVTNDNDKELIGITSFGIILGCEFGWPPAFTRVTKYLVWIGDNKI